MIRNSNWAAGIAPIELVLLRFRVRRLVIPHAVLGDVFQNQLEDERAGDPK